MIDCLNAWNKCLMLWIGKTAPKPKGRKAQIVEIYDVETCGGTYAERASSGYLERGMGRATRRSQEYREV